jgi:hypothetical protein
MLRYATWGINNGSVVSRSSEMYSHPFDMTIIKIVRRGHIRVGHPLLNNDRRMSPGYLTLRLCCSYR